MSPTKVADVLEKVKEANTYLKPLQPLTPIAISHGAKLIKIDPNAKYLIFLSNEAWDHMGKKFITDINNPIPAGTPVYIVDDVDRAIKIYEILDTKATNSHA